MVYIYSHVNKSVLSSTNGNDITNTALQQLQTTKLQQTHNNIHINTKINYPPIQAYNITTSQYPLYKSLLSIVEAWNPDDPDPPTQFEETLQHFNYSNLYERQLAEQYRNAELPFKIYNVPGWLVLNGLHFRYCCH